VAAKAVVHVYQGKDGSFAMANGEILRLSSAVVPSSPVVKQNGNALASCVKPDQRDCFHHDRAKNGGGTS
jgi:hypothetical protein